MFILTLLQLVSINHRSSCIRRYTSHVYAIMRNVPRMITTGEFGSYFILRFFKRSVFGWHSSEIFDSVVMSTLMNKLYFSVPINAFDDNR
jgi:hypothetical protein